MERNNEDVRECDVSDCYCKARYENTRTHLWLCNTHKEIYDKLGFDLFAKDHKLSERAIGILAFQNVKTLK